MAVRVAFPAQKQTIRVDTRRDRTCLLKTVSW